MVSMDLWLHQGQKVKINNLHFEGRTGIIKAYYWVTGEYLVMLEDGKTGLPIPFRPSEIEKVA